MLDSNPCTQFGDHLIDRLGDRPTSVILVQLPGCQPRALWQDIQAVCIIPGRAGDEFVSNNLLGRKQCEGANTTRFPQMGAIRGYWEEDVKMLRKRNLTCLQATRALIGPGECLSIPRACIISAIPSCLLCKRNTDHQGGQVTSVKGDIIDCIACEVCYTTRCHK